MTTQTKTTWRKVKLGEVMSTARIDFEKVKTSEYKTTGRLPIFDQGSDNIAGYTDNPKAEYRGKSPAILFGDHTLKLKIAKPPFAIGADGIQILEPDEGLLDRKFFYYAIKELRVRSYGYERHMKYLRELEIACPVIPDQKRIAGMLSAFDDKIELNNKISAALEQMAQAIFKEWFVNFRFPGHEKIKMVDSELGKIPEGWEVKQAKDLVKRLPQGKTYRPEKLEKKGVVPVYDQSSGIILGYHSNEPAFSASIDEPVAIFGDHTCRMKLATHPCSLGPNVVPFVGKDYSTMFVYYLTKDTVVQREYKRHWTEFEQQEFLVPPQNLAVEFASYVKPMVQKIVETENENQKLAALRDLLLPKLMSGEIRV